jgi:rare lipoprotein A
MLARASFVVLACVTLANCSSGSKTGNFNAKLGVTGSPRVVELGQPIPKGGGAYRVGKPYVIAGRTYVPREDKHYRGEGLGSWYGEDFHGRLTANGEVYDMEALSAAHPTMPLPSYARVTNLVNGRSIVVRVNDRGPYHQDREIDLSMKAADVLGYKKRGTTRVRVEYIGPAPLEGTDDRQLMATLRDGEAAPAPSSVRVASRSPFGGLFGSGPRGNAPVPPRAELEQDDPPPSVEPKRLRPRTAEIRTEEPEVSSRDEVTPERLTSPANSSAPLRDGGARAVTTGRGLY